MSVAFRESVPLLIFCRWGESAGAISVALHMLVNDGDNRGLFRAGFMQSGSPPAILGLENGQQCMNVYCFLCGDMAKSLL